MEYVWIGVRKSDITYSSIFKYSITTFGDNKENNFSYCIECSKRVHRGSVEEFLFIKNKMNYLISKLTNVKFVFYDQSEIVMFKEYSDYIICKNEDYLLNILNSKTQSKVWLEKFTKIIPYLVMPIGLIKYNEVKEIFNSYDDFVFQAEYGHSGNGTFLVNNNDDIVNVKKQFNSYTMFLITPKINNYQSVNQHAIISKSNIVLLQPSTQISFDRNHFYYSGNIFNKETQFYEKLVYKETKHLANILQKIGYVGILGIDYLVSNEKIYTIEINPRFQGSSIIINKMLSINNLPSLQEIWINIDNNELLDKIKKLQRIDGYVNYNNNSNFKNVKNNILCDGYGYEYNSFDNNVYCCKEIIFENEAEYY